MAPANTRLMQIRRWEHIYELREAGVSWDEIAENQKCHETTVRRLHTQAIKYHQGWYTSIGRINLLKKGKKAGACIHCRFYTADRENRYWYPVCTLGPFTTSPQAGCKKFRAK